MALNHVLIVSQVIPQWYVDVLTDALGQECQIDIITGSTEIRGNIISSPEHEAESLKSRLICWYKHFIFMNRWMKENKNKKYDMIFAVSNPPINSYIGLQLKKRFNAPFVYMNWDLYPQVIERNINNPLGQLVCKIWHKWNNRNYPKIDQLLTIGDVMSESMTAHIKHKISVDVIPVSVDVEKLKPLDKTENPFCIEHELTDKFVVLYSGKMGIGHNIELILDAANLLRNNKKIVFVFIGNGPKYSLVDDYIRRNALTNIQLYPLQSEEIFPNSIACGDIGIVTQEASMADLFMPSKTYSMMACGEAIVGICTKHDDLYGLLKCGEFGVAVTEMSAEKMALVINELYENKERLKIMQSAARKCVERLYSNRIIEKRYREIFLRYEK